jgi:hypothetical protein
MVMEPIMERVNQAWLNSNLGATPYGVYTDRPLMNQPTIFAKQPLEVLTRPAEFTRYMEWFKKTPECVSLVSSMVTDVLADGYYFEGSKSGRDKASDFMEENNGMTQLEGGLFDMFILGQAFWYNGELSEERAKEMRDAYMKSRRYRNYEFVTRLLENLDKGDESAGNKRFQYVPATTMNVTPSDRFATGLIYTQRVGAYVSAFTEKEIIQLKDMNLNGELWGTSRFKSIMAEVTLLGILKDYYGHQLDNYGVPPGMFSFPDEQPDSPNIQNINHLLIEGQKVENKNRVWVLAGNAEYTPFERLKDMEFKNLADFLTNVIAMVWQVPPSRYGRPAGKGGKETPLSNQGYYRNISHLQTKVEMVLNSQIFKPEFKVNIKFFRTHREDEVRVAQAEKIKTDLVEQRLKIGLWKFKTALKYLNITEEDAGEFNKDAVTGASKFNQVAAGNETLRHTAELEANKTKAPTNRSASSDVRAGKNK